MFLKADYDGMARYIRVDDIVAVRVSYWGGYRVVIDTVENTYESSYVYMQWPNEDNPQYLKEANEIAEALMNALGGCLKV